MKYAITPVGKRHRKTKAQTLGETLKKYLVDTILHDKESHIPQEKIVEILQCKIGIK